MPMLSAAFGPMGQVALQRGIALVLALTVICPKKEPFPHLHL